MSGSNNVKEFLSADLDQLDFMCRHIIGGLWKHDLIDREKLFALSRRTQMSIGTLSAVFSLAEYTCTERDAEEALLRLIADEGAPAEQIDRSVCTVVVVTTPERAAVVVGGAVLWEGDRRGEAKEAVANVVDGMSQAADMAVLYVHHAEDDGAAVDWVQLATGEIALDIPKPLN